MKDKNDLTNGASKVQDTLYREDNFEINAIAGMTRDEVVSELRQLGIQPITTVPQQLRQLITAETPEEHPVNVKSIFASMKEWASFLFQIPTRQISSRDDRLYAFILARTTPSKARIRRIHVRKRWLRVSAALSIVMFCAAIYGVYSLTVYAREKLVERENLQLRAENEKQRQQLESLNNRVEAVEDASKRLAKVSGVNPEQSPDQNGAGGPFVPLEDATAVENKSHQLELELRLYEIALRERTAVPSIWPVEGSLEGGYGVRRNPFGGSSYEAHEGQDIEALMGTPVVAAASGTVIIAGCQNGYGNVVYIDHGNGLSTRYGHLSHIDVTVGQKIMRGELLGRVGSTGRSNSPHLHYEVRINNEPVNPRHYLPGAEE
jgi:murein DD-endopeptidase MepM/ murein hydrolase activator NlpD